MHSEPVYNPLVDKHNLSVSVADALLAKAPGALPPEDPFIGAGSMQFITGATFQPIAVSL